MTEHVTPYHPRESLAGRALYLSLLPFDSALAAHLGGVTELSAI